MGRPSGLSLAMLLMVMKSCVIFIVVYQSFTLLVKPYLLDVKLYGQNHLLAFVAQYAVFITVVVVTDIITYLILLDSSYETIKFFLIISLLCQLIILFPFAVSGIVLAATTIEAPQRAFSSPWINKFHLIQRYSSNLTAPQFNTSRTQDVNNSNTTEDVTGVRDLPENRHLIRKLDQLLKFVDSVQRRLECCGVEGSQEWLNLYSGTFVHPKKTKQDLWWSGSWLPMRYTRSCCPHTNFLCSVYVPKNETKGKYYTKWVTGCRKKAVREIARGIRVICSFLIGAISLQLILSPLIYFLLERKRRVERVIYNRRWKQHLDVVLQQQKKEASSKPQHALQTEKPTEKATKN